MIPNESQTSTSTPVSRRARRRAVRLALVAWVVFVGHFATNVEREHYVAFAIVDEQSLQVDDYLGLHPDIFLHTDGHSYVGNNVAAAFLAAVPLFVFDPALDFLERKGKERRDARGADAALEYRTYDHHPNRKAFFEKVTSQGLELRFGGATAVTSAFLMAPLSAMAVALLFLTLVARGVSIGNASWLSVFFAFATPVFFRTAALNHNLMLMYAAFGSFLLIWRFRDGPIPTSWQARALAGALAGSCLAMDYAGVVALLSLYAYLVFRRAHDIGFWASFRESLVFVAGSVPPVLVLLATQYAMFANPFLPGQYWMPEVNYTDRGFRGFSWPNLDLFLRNLFDPRWGMFLYTPLLFAAFIPIRWLRRTEGNGGTADSGSATAAGTTASGLVLPRLERRYVWLFIWATLLFNAANQYAYMQWNTGFRYLVILLPFFLLLASDHLLRLPSRWLKALIVLSVINGWVVAMYREHVLFSWAELFSRGPMLPWFNVLRMTTPETSPLQHTLLPTALVLLCVGAAAAVWFATGRYERAAPA